VEMSKDERAAVKDLADRQADWLAIPRRG
jgi:hypothetical protein